MSAVELTTSFYQPVLIDLSERLIVYVFHDGDGNGSLECLIYAGSQPNG